MRVSIRRISAILLMVFFVAPFAAIPLQAYGAISVESVLAALDRGQLGLSLDDRLLRTPISGLAGLELFASNFGPSIIGSAPAGPVEVIIDLQGNSLAAEQAERRQLGLAPLSGDEQSAYVASLRESQAALVQDLEAQGVRVLYDYQILYNGIAAVVDGGQIQTLSGLPQVAGVARTELYGPALDNSVPFIFGGRTNAELGVDGSGVTIAVLDTGIDYTHLGLGGSGDPADYVTETSDPTMVQVGFNAKVIGGIDLVGAIFDARVPAPAGCSNTPVEDEDPIDFVNHGSHVSGIAAGLGTGAGGLVPPGVAPGASLLAVKIFADDVAGDGCVTTSGAVITAALEFAADPNGDGDTSDAVDVVNMSIGSPYGRGTSEDAVASDAAVDEGIIVVASAGNDGDLPYVTGSPASASKAISVAAGQDPGVGTQFLTVEGSVSGAADGDFIALEASFTPPLASLGTRSGLTEFVGFACDVGGAGGPNPFLPDSLDGKIPLISRGACRFDEKILNVEEAGAVAAVVFNNIAGAGPIVMGGDPIVTIPGFMIGNPDGLAIAAAIGEGTTFTLDPANFIAEPDRIAGFSSSGPRFVDSSLKPDITAPGVSIASVLMGSGTGALSISGTSMSSPHIAGSAALLRELHPDWSVEEIKAVLMNTATDASPNGLPYPVSRMGAGRAQIDVAVETESVVVPGSASFLVREDNEAGWRSFEVDLEVRNKGTEDKEFELSSAFIFPSDDEGSIQILHDDEIDVDAGESEDFELTLRVNFDALAPESVLEEYDGFLTLTETTSGGDVLRVPFHIIPYARADGEVDDDDLELPDDDRLELENDGIRGTLVDIYQFGVFDPNEDLISEAPGAPNDPDDWFDVRHTGAHAFDVFFGRILEFAMTTHGSRSVANFMETDIFLDIDGGGPDYVVVTADLGAFGIPGIPFPDGRMVSAVFDLAFGVGFLEFFVTDLMNTAIQTIPIVIEDLNFIQVAFGLPPRPTIDLADPDFDYFVATFDFETDAFDVTDTASFNAIAPEIDTDPNFLFLFAGDEVEVDVLATAEGGILALFYNNISGRDQSQVVDVELDDDDDDEDEEDDD